MKTFLLIICIASSALALNKSRRIVTKTDEVAEVKTALGIATKILLPENPNAAPIIGDLGAYRVEMIDKGYAVKPLRSGAKTNLFISTASRPYTVKLSIVNQDLADYIVYLTSVEVKSKWVVWRDFKRKVKSDSFTFETKRIGKTQDGFLILDFSLKTKLKIFIEASWFYLKQGKFNSPIHSLILSSREIDENKPLTGSLSINLRQLSSDVSAKIEFHQNQNVISIEIPREYLWRN